MKRNKTFTRIATGITAGTLLTVGAASFALSAQAAPRADQNTTPGTSQSTPADAGKGMGKGKGMTQGSGKDMGAKHAPGGPGMKDHAERGVPVHGERVVKNADGTFTTHVDVNGTATAVSATSISVKAADGFTATFNVNSNTKVRTSATGTAITDIKVGDVVHVDGSKSGETLTAVDVHAGMPGGPKA
jgi:hypothetical protein